TRIAAWFHLVAGDPGGKQVRSGPPAVLRTQRSEWEGQQSGVSEYGSEVDLIALEEPVILLDRVDRPHLVDVTGRDAPNLLQAAPAAAAPRDGDPPTHDDAIGDRVEVSIEPH